MILLSVLRVFLPWTCLTVRKAVPASPSMTRGSCCSPGRRSGGGWGCGHRTHPLLPLRPPSGRTSDMPSGQVRVTRSPPCPYPTWLQGKIPGRGRGCSVPIPHPHPAGPLNQGVSPRSRISLFSPARSLRNAIPFSSLPLWGAAALLVFRRKLCLPQSCLLPATPPPRGTPPPNLPSTLQPTQQLLSLGGPRIFLPRYLQLISRDPIQMAPALPDALSPRPRLPLCCGSPEVRPGPSLVLTASHKLRGLTPASRIPNFPSTHPGGPMKVCLNSDVFTAQRSAQRKCSVNACHV